MERKIVGFHLDDRRDWVAELDCFHGQHVRHKPPFINRPWVESDMGRAEQLGAILNCVRCDEFEMPEDLIPYKQTPHFDENSVPTGLLKEHSTKVGVWGSIEVVSGALLYSTQKRTVTLSPGVVGIIPPQLVHSVAPEQSVIFYVQFYSKQAEESV